ncbi:MAG: tetratricopeptide repeat protein [Fulvivirga sp.]|nr:tetratricopeptide repeat protein [Fulvivirga sp.]
MRFIFLLIIFLSLGWSHHVCSQTSRINVTDSLNSLLSTTSDPDSKVDILHQLILENWLNYPSEAIKYANRAIALSDSLGDGRAMAKSIRLKGGTHYYLGNYDSALFYNKKSLQAAVSIGDSLLINNALNNIGLAYYNLGSYQNALENLLRALNIKKAINEVYGRAQTLNNIGLVYGKLKDYKKARKYFNDALNFSRKHNNYNLQLYSLNNLANTYLVNNSLEEALNYFEKAKALEVDNKNWNAVTLSGLGQIYQLQGDFDKSKEFFEKALYLRADIGDKNGISEIYYFYAREEKMQNKYDSALIYLDKSQDIALEIGSKDRAFENLEMYVDIFNDIGEVDKAFQYQSELLRLRDTLFNESMARNLADIQLKIQEEESRRVLDIKEQQLSESKRFTIFLIIIIFLTLAILFIILRNYRKNQKVNSLLERQNREINHQKNEIIQQKESLLHKNVELEKAHKVIREQNETLEKYNEKLKRTVDERTLELEQRNKELQLANLELDNFIYKSSHDIKGPLATLMGVCNVAMMDVNDEKSKQYFEMLANTAQGLNDILARLKTVSDINSLEITVKPIDFQSIIESCLEQVKNTEGVKKINLIHDIEAGVNYKADPLLIDLIIFNMIQNAVKFQDAEGEAYIKITVKEEDDTLIMHFMDNGIGIEDEDADDIFQMFSKSAIKHQTLGLGLYLVKQCVQKLGGEIMLINDQDELTHFRVVLPKFS